MALDQQEWRVGDTAVYPRHGVGRITAIETNTLFGTDAKVYVLELLHTARRILIPTDKAEQNGLRPVIDNDAGESVIGSLKEDPPPSRPMPWTKRHRALLEKLSSGNLFDVAQVLRELYDLKGLKDLSFGQRQLFDRATDLLVQELAISLDSQPDDVEQRIHGIFIAKDREKEKQKEKEEAEKEAAKEAAKN